MATLSDTWQQRTAGGRLSVNSQHLDFPALISEALDVIEAHDFVISAAAKHLGVSASQLIKLLKVDRQVAVWVNQQRQNRGMTHLR